MRSVNLTRSCSAWQARGCQDEQLPPPCASHPGSAHSSASWLPPSAPIFCFSSSTWYGTDHSYSNMPGLKSCGFRHTPPRSGYVNPIALTHNDWPGHSWKKKDRQPLSRNGSVLIRGHSPAAGEWHLLNSVYVCLKIAHEQLARFSNVLISWRIILHVQSACKRFAANSCSLCQDNYLQKLHRAASGLQPDDFSGLRSKSCEQHN